MCPVKYYDILKDSVNPFNYRVRMAQYAYQFGISAAAREFGTTRDTVRKWAKRYQAAGTRGVNNKSKAPHHIPHKTPKQIEEEVLKHRDRLPSWGPIRLKEDFNLPISTAAIYRILKQKKRIKKHKRKYQRQQDLRLIKMQMNVFQKIQIDVKDLIDIPNYLRFKRSYDLPRYQYTARDVKSGLLYIAYARRNDCVNAANFLSLVGQHLKEHGIDLSRVIVQTDNGSEFVGNWRQRDRSLFTKVAENAFGMKHYRIPPRRCTYNSDVESSHLRIEKDFYDLEEFFGEESLNIKAFTYLLYFNLLRKNKAKFNKSSFEIIRDEHPGIKTTICAFKPVVLDELGSYYLESFPSEPCGKTVDYLPELVIF